MTTDMLKRIVETLDVLESFDRSTRINPVFILDSHGSRLGLSFLKYINNSAHIIFVAIGILYRTSLW